MKKKKDKTAEKLSHYNTERGHVFALKRNLAMLVLGTLIAAWQLGQYVVGVFELTGETAMIVAFLHVVAAYYGIDWTLKHNILSACNVEKKDKEDRKETKKAWRYVYIALFFSFALSMSANIFSSDYLAGASQIEEYNEKVDSAFHTANTLKLHAFALLESSGKEEQSRILAADELGRQRIRKAVSSSPTPHYRKDYEKAKNRRGTWFWICKEGVSGCPANYVAYRNRILEAESYAKKVAAEARGYQAQIQTSLSPTLSYQLEQDSMITGVLYENYAELEAQRVTKKWVLFIILAVFTFAAGVLTLLQAGVLREHRENHGQQIVTDNMRFLMISTDAANRLKQILADVLFTVFSQPHQWLLKRGYLKRYRVEPENISFQLHASVSGEVDYDPTAHGKQKGCQACGTDIAHKRSDARFCDDACRYEYHNSTRKGTRRLSKAV
jgi:hypothetical protein